jgi:hypothetical protein
MQWLKDYGATDVRFDPTHDHPRLTYHFRGTSRTLSLARTPSDVNHMRVLKRRLRAELGDPVTRHPRDRRKLADMDPQVTPGITHDHNGSVAYYNNGSLRFFPPDDFFEVGTSVSIEHLGRDARGIVWAVRSVKTPAPGEKAPTVRPDGSAKTFEKHLSAMHSGLALGLEKPTGRSPAVWVQADPTTWMVHFDPANRQVGPNMGSSVARRKPPPPQPAHQPAPAPANWAHGPVHIPNVGPYHPGNPRHCVKCGKVGNWHMTELCPGEPPPQHPVFGDHYVASEVISRLGAEDAMEFCLDLIADLEALGTHHLILDKATRERAFSPVGKVIRRRPRA